MTVCVATFAEKSRAILMISDKAVTFGDNIYRPAMQSDTGVNKRLRIGKNWRALVAGDPGFASAVVRDVERHIEADTSIANSYRLMIECVSENYARLWGEAIHRRVLTPHLLTKDLLTARPNTMLPLPQDYFDSVIKRVREFGVGCSVLVCGFDKSRDPHVFSVDSAGDYSDHDLTGFHAIGIGSEAAIARLLNWSADRRDRLDEALYQAFDAKAHAEIIQGVGYAWDGYILTPRKGTRVPRTVQRAMDKLFDETTRSPFDRSPRHSTTKWVKTIKTFTRSIQR